MRPIIFTGITLASIAASAGDEGPQFTTAKAKDAWKAYQKASEKAKAEFEAKMKKEAEEAAKKVNAEIAKTEVLPEIAKA